jgi:hypothetical protein
VLLERTPQISHINFLWAVCVRDFWWPSVCDTDTTIAFFGKVRRSYLPNSKHVDAHLTEKLINTLSVRWDALKQTGGIIQQHQRRLEGIISYLTKTMVSRKNLRQRTSIWESDEFSSGNHKQVFEQSPAYSHTL